MVEKFLRSRFYFLVSNNKTLYIMWVISTILFSFLSFFMDFPDKILMNKNIVNGSIYLVALALVGAYFMNLIEQMRINFNDLINGNVKEFFINLKFFLLFVLFISVLVIMKLYSIVSYRELLPQIIAFLPIFIIGLWIYSLNIFDETQYQSYIEKRKQKALQNGKTQNSFNNGNKKVKV